MKTRMKCLPFLTVLLCLSIPATNAAASDSKLLQLVMPAVSAATGPRWRTPQLIETNGVGDAEEAKIAINSSGNAIAVWRQSDGSKYSIWANRYAVESGWENAQLIETGNDGDALSPQVGIDAAGNAIAVWDHRVGSRYDIWANRYVAGSGWENSQVIGLVPWLLSSWYPQVAVSSAGDAIAVWSQDDGNNHHIFFNLYSAGSGWKNPQCIEDNPKISSSHKVAMDSKGNAVVIWGDWDGIRSSIAVRHYNVTSGWEIITHHIEAQNLGDANSPNAAIDSNGNVIAVWRQRDGNYSRLLANRYVAGSGWGTAQIIDDYAGEEHPQIVVDSKGNAIVVWQKGEGDHIHIWANRYVAGNGWGTAQLISDHSGLAWPPQIAVDPAGNAIAVWFQYASPSGSISHIWANRYVAGSGWGTAQIIDSNNTGGASYPRVAIDSKGRAIAIWQQADSHANIWAARYE